MLAVLAYYGLFRRLGGNYAGVLTLMTVIILILWADKHQAPGNDAFVRLYQGKSIFYAVVCPYLLSSAIGVLTRFPGSKFRLAIASITGIGLTQSALILIPLFFAGLSCNSMDNLPRTTQASAPPALSGGHCLIPGVGRYYDSLYRTYPYRTES